MTVIYLDANIVIFLIEQPPGWGVRAAARFNAAQANGDRFLVSDLCRMECRVRPISLGDHATLGQFDAFFVSSDVRMASVTPAAFERATWIRARHKYRTADALHLAVAVEAGCDLFLTSDVRLGGFPDLKVEVLP